MFRKTGDVKPLGEVRLPIEPAPQPDLSSVRPLTREDSDNLRRLIEAQPGYVKPSESK